MKCYYNEFDKQKAAWLRELISDGAIAAGDVDDRSISDVRPDDLRGYRQCHFFAGIGIWSYALRLAGWPDDREVWTGSCPCQPFSDAGKKEAFDDARHLWPDLFRLIAARRPVVCFGEQVASADGLAWFDAVYSDMGNAGYSAGALDLCAAGFGAPHRRQRLYWVAESDRGRRERRAPDAQGSDCDGAAGGRDEGNGIARRVVPVRGMADTEHAERRPEHQEHREAHGRGGLGRGGAACLLADADGGNTSAERLQRGGEQRLIAQDGGTRDGIGRPGPANGFWRDADWIFCRDRRWRPVEAGTFPLAHGTPARMGRLRGYGDGIVSEVAAAFIRAYLDDGRLAGAGGDDE